MEDLRQYEKTFDEISSQLQICEYVKLVFQYRPRKQYKRKKDLRKYMDIDVVMKEGQDLDVVKDLLNLDEIVKDGNTISFTYNGFYVTLRKHPDIYTSLLTSRYHVYNDLGTVVGKVAVRLEVDSDNWSEYTSKDMEVAFNFSNVHWFIDGYSYYKNNYKFDDALPAIRYVSFDPALNLERPYHYHQR